MTANWRQRQKTELGQLLYDTALKLFSKNGYEATTVAQITTVLGVAKGTFFNHFPSKEHVLAQWYNTITRKSLEAARTRDQGDAQRAVASLFADMSSQATASEQLMVAKFGHCTNPILMEAETHQVEELQQFIGEQIARGKASGSLDSKLEVEPFVDLLVAVLTGTSRAWVYTQPRFNFPKVIAERVAFLFRAAGCSET